MIQESSRALKGSSWYEFLKAESSQPYFSALDSFLESEKAHGRVIFPEPPQIFAALQCCELSQTKVVILGQDPYHKAGQAHGLSFSVPVGQKLPPSLRNIFKELASDLSVENKSSASGDLTAWAQQGVLLLNSVLTVESGKAASHEGRGWEQLTDAVIKKLNQEKTQLVYILWGSYAQKKAKFIDRSQNLVLQSVHPSPLSAHRGFFGSKPFSQANAHLKKIKLETITWESVFW